MTLTDIRPVDVWERLAQDDRPLYIYGMGNGADKLCDRLALYGRTVDGIFASDEFVRGQTFRGFPVLRYDDVVKKERGDFIILIAFASARPEVLSYLHALSARHTVLMPSLPVLGENVFDRAFYTAHREDYENARALFSDIRSLTLFDSILRFRLSGELSDLGAGDTLAEYRAPLMLSTVHTLLDGGAYDGDTVREFLSLGAPLTRVLSVEPDTHNYKKLCAYAQTTDMPKVTPIPCALGEYDGETTFCASGNRNAGIEALSHRYRTETVSLRSIDSLCEETGFSPDCIKLDLEGAELPALRGARATIARRPRVSVAAYHRPEDLYAVPLFLSSIYPRGRFFLRRRECLPDWEFDVMAIPCDPDD